MCFWYKKLYQKRSFSKCYFPFLVYMVASLLPANTYCTAADPRERKKKRQRERNQIPEAWKHCAASDNLGAGSTIIFDLRAASTTIFRPPDGLDNDFSASGRPRQRFLSLGRAQTIFELRTASDGLGGLFSSLGRASTMIFDLWMASPLGT